jgi:hypothetical protein
MAPMAFADMATATNTRTNVPMISEMRLASVLRMAGPVQKMPSLKLGSVVSF